MTIKVAQELNGQQPGATYSGPAALQAFYLAHGYIYDDTNTSYLGNNTDTTPANDPTLAVNREDPGDAFQFGADESALGARYEDIWTQDPALNVANLPAAGGTVVIVEGDNFTGATSVTFGGTAGTAFSVTDDNHIKVTTPAKTAGTYDVVVVKAAGNATGTGVVTYI